MSLKDKKCVPCEGGTPPLERRAIAQYLSELTPGWEVSDDKKISKTFDLKTFKKAIGFVNSVADLAEAEGHHPNIKIFYNKVIIDLTTHAIGGLSENDFILASKIDLL